MLSSDARHHFERYWKLCREFYERGDFALASFFSITLIEETGKIIILANKELSDKLDKKGFRDHREKYAYAVYETLLINSRVSRIYGKQEERFAKWFANNELFGVRNSTLYLDLNGENVIVPHKVIKKKDAFLLVCFAGEIYAEIQGSRTGSDAEEWQRILSEIDSFRKENSDSRVQNP